MEALNSGISNLDVEKADLEQLLEAFGSAVSLEEIASAYCQARRDVCDAGEILCNLLGSTSSTSTRVPESKREGLIKSSQDRMLDQSINAERNCVKSRHRNCSVSTGSVSSIIARDYTQQRASRKASCEGNKPLRLNVVELPISDIWDEKFPSNGATNIGTLHKDVEDFLFQMLGDGFQLDMEIIQKALGQCGYDVQKSMDQLLELSVSSCREGKSIGIASDKPTGNYSGMESISCKEKFQHRDSLKSDKTRFMTKNEPLERERDRDNLPKEVLEALFTVPERSEEAPSRTFQGRETRRLRAFGQVVVEPLKDTRPECKAAIAKPQVDENEKEEDEDGYQVLRQAVQEYWFTMKEYYKAAAEAFAKGDYPRADKLLAEGHFYKKKAQEADEKSAKKFLENSEEEEFSLDLNELEPKEAIRLLRLHLTNLSGIPTFQYLKVVVGSNTEDTKRENRKRLIMKLLERESIKWTEESSGQIIVIQLDEINPKSLGFGRKGK